MTRLRSYLTPLLVGLVLTPALAAAQGETRTHTVKTGDTLWDLAQLYLGDPFKWPEIYRRNQSTIQDPNLIYPDQVIIISGDVMPTAGTPADTAMAAEQPVDTMAMDSLMMDSTGGQVEPVAPPSMTIFNPDRFRVVRGERQSLRIQDPASAVRAGDFLQAPFMWADNGVGGAGRIIEGSSTDGIGITNTERPIQYMEQLWLSVPDGVPGMRNDRLLVFRYGPRVSGQGRVVIPTGIVRLSGDAANGRAQAIVIAKFEDIFVDQGVMPLDTLQMDAGVYPQRVEFGLATRISYMYGEPVLPPVGHQVIFAANEGDGLKPGDQITLMVPGGKAADGTELPPQDIAVAQITRVTQWGASAIIMSQTDGGIITGMAGRVTGKMP
jgi:hypothetical protein